MFADSVSRLCYSAQMSRRVLGLLVFMLASLLGLLLLPPIVQNQNYHDFADQRTLFGIPNFWNVVSNIPFIGIGAVGLWQFGRSPATMLLFLGIFLTGFGSAYYHLEPNDQTLFWDRLPMAISFMAILTIAIEERVDRRAGAILLWPMTAIGVFSLLLWHWTGDLRLYAWVQFFPCLALPLIFILFAPRFSGTIYWLIAAALYALAKLFECRSRRFGGSTNEYLARASRRCLRRRATNRETLRSVWPTGIRGRNRCSETAKIVQSSAKALREK
jgi:hypothetical protein